jgi:hypothetical protein
MPCQAKTEVLQFLHLETRQQVIDSFDLLLGIGYEGTLAVSKASARIDMQMSDGVPVSVSIGDVFLYRTSPAPQVVSCKTWDEFNATFDILP